MNSSSTILSIEEEVLQGLRLLGSIYHTYLNIFRLSGESGFASPALLCLLYFLTASFTPLPANAAENNRHIVIAYQKAESFNQPLIEQFQQELGSAGYQISQYTPDGDIVISKGELNQQHLVIAIGSKTTQQLLESQLQNPILSLLMPRHLADSLRALYPEKKNWSNLLIDQPVERHFHLITSILGKHQQTGVLLGPYTNNMEASLKKAASKTDHEIITEHISDSDQLTQSLSNLNNRSNVLLTLPDPVVFNRNTIRGILLSSYRSRLPIIGFSQAYVKAGAIAAVYSQPGQISKQAVNIISDFFIDNIFLQKDYYPNEFSVALNTKVAHSLGIRLETSTAIIDKIKKAEQ